MAHGVMKLIYICTYICLLFKKSNLWHVVPLDIWGARCALLLLTYCLFVLWHCHGGTTKSLLDTCLTFQENMLPRFRYIDCTSELFLSYAGESMGKLHQALEVPIKPWPFYSHSIMLRRFQIFAAWLEGATRMLSEIHSSTANSFDFSFNK